LKPRAYLGCSIKSKLHGPGGLAVPYESGNRIGQRSVIKLAVDTD
jgi:hypothetical protein